MAHWSTSRLLRQQRRQLGRGPRHLGRAPGDRLEAPRPEAHLGRAVRPAGAQVHGEVRAHHVLQGAGVAPTAGDVEVAEGAVHGAGGRVVSAGAALSVALEQDPARVGGVVGRLHEAARLARRLREVLLAHAREELAVRGRAIDGALGRRARRVVELREHGAVAVAQGVALDEDLLALGQLRLGGLPPQPPRPKFGHAGWSRDLAVVRKVARVLLVEALVGQEERR
mmetsp:Transcript_8770/g.20689  ORF Transcript_8770/g.20689 Transcript_8770/m.20689 type:complete len:226 (-) Transcript_8770:53-730(-)